MILKLFQGPHAFPFARKHPVLFEQYVIGQNGRFQITDIFKS